MIQIKGMLNVYRLNVLFVFIEYREIGLLLIEFGETWVYFQFRNRRNMTDITQGKIISIYNIELVYFRNTNIYYMLYLS